MTFVGIQGVYNLRYKVEVYDGTSWVEVRTGTGTLDRDIDYISTTLTLQGIDGAYWYRKPDAIQGADGQPLLKSGRRIRLLRIWGKTSPITEQRFVGYIGTPKYDAKTQKVSVEAYCDLYWVLRSEVLYDTIDRNNSTKHTISFNGSYDETKVELYSETTGWYDYIGYLGGLVRPRVAINIPSEYSTRNYIVGRLSNVKLQIRNPGPFLADQVHVKMTTYIYINGDTDQRIAQVETEVHKTAKVNDILEFYLGDLSFALTSYPSQINFGADFELLDGNIMFSFGAIWPSCYYRYIYDVFVNGYETTNDAIVVDKTVIGDGIVLTIEDNSGNSKTIDDSMFVGVKLLSPFVNPKTKDWYTQDELTEDAPTPTSLIAEKELLPGAEGFVLGALKGQIIIPSAAIPEAIKAYVASNGWSLSDIARNVVISVYLIDSNFTLQALLSDLLSMSGASNLSLTSTYPTLVKVGTYSIPKRTKFEDLYREFKNGILPRSYILYSDPDGNIKDDVYSISSISGRQFSRAKNRTPSEKDSDELVTAYQMQVGKVDSLEILQNKAYYIGLDTDQVSSLVPVNQYSRSMFEQEINGSTKLYAFLQPDVTPRYIDIQFEYKNANEPVEVSAQTYVVLWEDLLSLPRSASYSFEDLPWKNVGGQGSNTYLDSGVSTIDISGMISRPIAAIKTELDVKGAVDLKRWFLYEDTEVRNVELSPYPTNVPAKVGKYVWNSDEEPTGEDVKNTLTTGYVDPIPGTTYKLISTKHYLYSPSMDRFEIDTDRPIVGTSNKTILLPYEGSAVANSKYLAVPYPSNCNRDEAQYGVACGIFKTRGTGLPKANVTQIDTWRIGHVVGGESYVFPTKGDLTGNSDGVLIFVNEYTGDEDISHDIFYLQPISASYTSKQISFTLPSSGTMSTIASQLPGAFNKKLHIIGAFEYSSLQIPYISRDLGRNDAFLVDEGIMKYLMTYAAFDTIAFNKETCPVTIPIDDNGNIVDFLDRVDIYDPDTDDFVPSVVLAAQESFSGQSITFSYDFGVLIE